ncbi:hypothetical protein D777_00110 [Marinobacter nitratireducens]|uniref:Uncharacterized protein n=1 Tax=Marinobacter nitratireducens TaxID=1137280 RepID=A0A072N7B5_9GAMM|nr:hypothetical protein D777_00110 [Marinobacter nitratireducens]
MFTPKMLGAMDGAEQAYRDVFTAVFGGNTQPALAPNRAVK